MAPSKLFKLGNGERGLGIDRASSEEFKALLRKFVEEEPELRCCAVISKKGNVVASAQSGGVDESYVGAVAAVLMALGERASKSFMTGALKRAFIESENTYLVAEYLTPELILAVLVEGLKLGALFIRLNRFVGELKKALGV